MGEYLKNMTVKQLIEKLMQFDPEMLIATNYDVYDDIDVSVKTWIHSNYPYDKQSFDFVSIE